jgi:hypothetical protein
MCAEEKGMLPCSEPLYFHLISSTLPSLLSTTLLFSSLVTFRLSLLSSLLFSSYLCLKARNSELLFSSGSIIDCGAV